MPKLILVKVRLVLPPFVHRMYAFPCFAEHYLTGSDQKSILNNTLQALPPGVQYPGTF